MFLTATIFSNINKMTEILKVSKSLKIKKGMVKLIRKTIPFFKVYLYKFHTTASRKPSSPPPYKSGFNPKILLGGGGKRTTAH